MSTQNRTKAASGIIELNGVSMDDVGHVGVVGLQGVIHALLDVADAIREQTQAIREQTDALKNDGVVVR